MKPALWVILTVLLVAVPVLALLFTGLWVVKLVQKYHMFSEEEEPADASQVERDKK